MNRCGRALMGVRRRQFLFAATGALAACALPKPRTDPHALASRLRSLAVSDQDFYRRTLYTWTTTDGIAKLRSSRTLLTALATDGGFTSAFIRLLRAHASTREPGAEVATALVEHPALIRRRYAWTAPFATVMGLGRRTYGHSLIKIELRPEAWLGRFEQGAEDPLHFVDADHAPVPLERVLRAPERIGAVFHVHAMPSFREYVVCSEAMVEQWSIATDEIRQQLAFEAELLRDVRDRGALSPTATELPASASWQARPANDVAELWGATLAFDNDRYHARPPQLDRILEALAGYEAAGAPLVVSPQAAAYSARSASHSVSSPT